MLVMYERCEDKSTTRKKKICGRPRMNVRVTRACFCVGYKELKVTFKIPLQIVRYGSNFTVLP